MQGDELDVQGATSQQDRRRNRAGPDSAVGPRASPRPGEPRMLRVEWSSLSGEATASHGSPTGSRTSSWRRGSGCSSGRWSSCTGAGSRPGWSSGSRFGSGSRRRWSSFTRGTSSHGLSGSAIPRRPVAPAGASRRVRWTCGTRGSGPRCGNSRPPNPRGWERRVVGPNFSMRTATGAGGPSSWRARWPGSSINTRSSGPTWCSTGKPAVTPDRTGSRWRPTEHGRPNCGGPSVPTPRRPRRSPRGCVPSTGASPRIRRGCSRRCATASGAGFGCSG